MSTQSNKWFIAPVTSGPNGSSFSTAIGPHSASLDEAIGAARFHAHMEMKSQHPEQRSPRSPEVVDLILHNSQALVTFRSKGYEDQTYYVDFAPRRWDAFQASKWGAQDANGIYQPR